MWSVIHSHVILSDILGVLSKCLLIQNLIIYFRLKTSLTQAENQLQTYQTQTDVKDTEVKSLMVKHGQVGLFPNDTNLMNPFFHSTIMNILIA